MSSPTTYCFSWGARIKWGAFEALVYKEPDGRARLAFDGDESWWPSFQAAKEEANQRLREVAGPNAAREGAEFGA